MKLVARTRVHACAWNGVCAAATRWYSSRVSNVFTARAEAEAKVRTITQCYSSSYQARF